MSAIVKHIEKHHRRGDSGIIAERLGIKPRKVWDQLKGHKQLQPDVAREFIALVKERKQIMEEISAL